MRMVFAILSGVSLLLLSSLTASANQGDTGEATTYKVTVTKFEMYNGTSWVTVSNGTSTEIDIAAVDSGQVAGNFFAGLSVPDGSYTQVKVTIANNFVISGSVGSDGTPIYTTATVSNNACVSTADVNSKAACTIGVPGGMPEPNPDILPTTLVISNGVPSHKIRVNFDVSAAITEGAASVLYPGNPTVTMQMIAL